MFFWIRECLIVVDLCVWMLRNDVCRFDRLDCSMLEKEWVCVVAHGLTPLSYDMLA